MSNIKEKMNKFFKKTGKFLLVILFLIIIFIAWVNYLIFQESKNFILQDIKQVPPSQAALILGASVKPNKEMSDVFRDRVDSAINLYSAGKVSDIIVSGDHGKKYYDEVDAAKKYLLERGIPPEDIFLDHAGFDTYDSLYRAKYIFNAKSIIVVTQNFHLPRAIFIARNLGHDVYGFSADLHRYQNANSMFFREVFADIKAYFDITFKSNPQFFGSKIDLNGDGRESWD